MTVAYIDVEVEVDLGRFDDQDLLQEIAERGLTFDSSTHGNSDTLIDKIFNARRCGKPYEHLLDEYLYLMTGRAI